MTTYYMPQITDTHLLYRGSFFAFQEFRPNLCANREKSSSSRTESHCLISQRPTIQPAVELGKAHSQTSALAHRNAFFRTSSKSE